MSEPLDPIAASLGDALRRRGLSLVVAESCTGGWLAKVATDIAGSSEWFDRGFVTYSNRSKQEMLGVSAATLEAEGAVSEAVVAQMAAGALTYSRARVSIAISGIAGPGGGSPEKPVGTVWFAWALPGTAPVTQRFQFAGDRDEVRHQAVRIALERLLELVEDLG